MSFVCSIPRPMDRRLTGLSTDRDAIMPFEGMQRYETDLPGGPQFITYQFGKWWTELKHLYFDESTALTDPASTYATTSSFFIAVRARNIYIRPNHVFTTASGYQAQCYVSKDTPTLQIEVGKYYQIEDMGNVNFYNGYGSQLMSFVDGEWVSVFKATNFLDFSLFEPTPEVYEVRVLELTSGTQYGHPTKVVRYKNIGDVWNGEFWGGSSGYGDFRLANVDQFDAAIRAQNSTIASLTATIATQLASIDEMRTAITALGSSGGGNSGGSGGGGSIIGFNPDGTPIYG